MKKNMLILGADGFIGKNCLNYFSQFPDKYHITVVRSRKNNTYRRNPNITYLVGIDLRKEIDVKLAMKGQDIVLQMAATTTGAKDVVNQPFVHVTDNAVMNSWIFREAHLQGIEHVIFPSCTVMYQSKPEPQKETDWSPSDKMVDVYFGVGNMKVFMENMCDFYSRLGTTRFTAIRHSNVYGPHDKFDLDKCHVVPAFINKIVNATDTLEIWGTGKASRDILYIDDLVDMIDRVIRYQKTPYELYNCGYGQVISIDELAQKIMNLEYKNLKVRYEVTKPNIPTTVRLNCDKAHRELDWYAWTWVDDGLKKTIDWYKENYVLEQK